MERREALRNVALLLGGTISASTFSVLFESCTPTEKKSDSGNLLSPDQETLITEISDVIIPDTDTPGAKAAGVGPFIAMMIRECYPENIQETFVDGLAEVEELSESKFKNSFVQLNPQEKYQVLREIADKTVKSRTQEEETEKERADSEKNNNQTLTKKPEKKTYFFQLIRELTLLGYFTSEIGATKALAYVPVPGKYEGCIDLKPGQKTWAL
ncbi:MAG TPA: gluconate 2-dehydrogenase subunit 3 family protein [Sphingobacteriaceae bacterium]